MKHRLARFGVVGVVLTLAASMLAPAASGRQGQPKRSEPREVLSKSTKTLAKLHPRLRNRVASGSTQKVPVFVTVLGGTGSTRALLDDSYVARTPKGSSLVVGTAAVQTLAKLANLEGVVSVGPIDLRQTGEPLASPDKAPRPSFEALRGRVENLKKNESPYSAERDVVAQGDGESHFEELKRLNLLDAKTHGFAQAWKKGFAGEGTNVAVLDGGTDFGHPDLVGTWKRGQHGWPQAYDPYGTLLWLVAPEFIDLGLSFYTRTESRDVSSQNPPGGGSYRVRFATRKGPSRNFSAPDETVQHTYRFPAAWTQSEQVRIGFHPDDYMLGIYEERPAVLVTDPNEAGEYDTVYVDLDNDYNFGDEKPVRKKAPASYRDLDDDGVADLSGGLLYYISDGTGRDGTPLRGGLGKFGVNVRGEPGELLAWTGDFDPAIGGHGTLTASNVAGQGVINGLAPVFSDLPGDGRYPGAVIGGAPKTKLVPFGDIYFSFDFSTQFGYLLANDANVNATSNSYGESDVDNDGWDAASQEADIWQTSFGGRTTFLGSTGNGGAGFGTTSPPSPYTGISVGASTQFGGTGWDSIDKTTQIVDNDVTTFSNRGPGATGAVGVDVVADGAYSAGDRTLNSVLDGQQAWETWGGTSRSTPVAAAATALIYQAYEKAHGSIPENFQFKARELLKSSSKDLGYPSYVQGAGSVFAGTAVDSARGRAGSVSPSDWRVGDYRGKEYSVFTHLMHRGESDTQTFEISGGGSWDVSDRVLRRTHARTMKFKSSPVSDESPYNFNAPNYLMDVTDVVNNHPDADLMVARAIYPHDQLDADGDYEADQTWRMLTYNWTDINGDGNLWTDKDGDGTVDHVTLDTSSNPDGFPDLDFSKSEMDKGEYVRFMYNNADHNTLQTAVRQPKRRTADGIFVGFQHDAPNEAIPQTEFKIRLEFYKNKDWSWLDTPSTAAGSLTAGLTVPSDAPYGMHDGAITLRQGRQTMVVPVSTAVGARPRQNADGELKGAMHFGGPEAGRHDARSLYNNGRMFGANDWGWRAESGDWRFFFYDVRMRPAEGSLFLANTTWEDRAPHTDIDTLIFGKSANEYQLAGPGPVGAPYIIDTVGNSPNTNIGAGTWTFNTATGGAEEFVTAPAQRGLHALVHHEVDWEGDKFWAPFETTVGSANVNPTDVDIDTSSDSGEFDVTFKSTIDLPGFDAEGFGLSQPSTTEETAQQDDPNDPSTSSVKVPTTLDHAARATFNVSLNQDIDLFIVYDANEDGQFGLNEIVGASATGSGDEEVTLVRPPDGDYQVWVHGFAISGSPEFPLTIFPVQGDDLTVSGVPAGPVDAGTPVTIHVEFTKDMVAGEDYFGELQMGPSTAPAAISVPVTVHKE